MARPSLFSDKIATEICERLALGESLRQICSDDEMPSKSTVMRWLFEEDKKAFQDQYAKAREALMEHWAEEIIDIADDATNDYMDRKQKDGSIEQVLNSEWITRSRLRVDTRKWLMSKLAPKKYGEKLETTHLGDKAHPLVVSMSDSKL